MYVSNSIYNWTSAPFQGNVYPTFIIQRENWPHGWEMIALIALILQCLFKAHHEKGDFSCIFFVFNYFLPAFFQPFNRPPLPGVDICWRCRQQRCARPPRAWPASSSCSHYIGSCRPWRSSVTIHFSRSLYVVPRIVYKAANATAVCKYKYTL